MKSERSENKFPSFPHFIKKVKICFVKRSGFECILTRQQAIHFSEGFTLQLSGSSV